MGKANIGLVGPRHSGKTTIANVLREQFDYLRIGLADDVKLAAETMLCAFHNEFAVASSMDVSVDAINRQKATFRPLLEWLGTTYVREYLGLPHYWIDTFRDKINDNTRRGIAIVCDDIRFPNEADSLRDTFLIVRLVRQEIPRQASLVAAGEPAALHIVSERTLDRIQADLHLLIPERPNFCILASSLDALAQDWTRPPFSPTLTARLEDISGESMILVQDDGITTVKAVA